MSYGLWIILSYLWEKGLSSFLNLHNDSMHSTNFILYTHGKTQFEIYEQFYCKNSCNFYYTH